LKYTSDGKPANQSEGQESISTKAITTTSSTSETSDTGTPKEKGIAKPINYNTKYINKPSSGKGKAIGSLIVIIIIGAIIAAVANWFYQVGRETDKLLELGCDPEAWNRWGQVTIWSCPAWRNIDPNDPKSFMDQSPEGPAGEVDQSAAGDEIENIRKYGCPTPKDLGGAVMCP
jgi:hypothetical protein